MKIPIKLCMLKCERVGERLPLPLYYEVFVRRIYVNMLTAILNKILTKCMLLNYEYEININ